MELTPIGIHWTRNRPADLASSLIDKLGINEQAFLAMLKIRKLSFTIDGNKADYKKWLLTKRGAASVASEDRREAKPAEKQLSTRRQNTSAPRSKIRTREKQLDALSAQKRDI